MIEKTEYNKGRKVRNKKLSYLKKWFYRQIFTNLKMLLDFDDFNLAVLYNRHMKFLISQSESGTTAIYRDLKKHNQFRYKSGTEGLSILIRYPDNTQRIVN